MLNLLLPEELVTKDLRDSLTNNLPHAQAKDIVLTIVHDQQMSEVFIRYSIDQDLREIKQIRNVIYISGLRSSLYRADLFQNILVSYFGFGPELYDLIHGNTMTPDVGMAFHNSEFRAYPSRVETLDGTSAPFAAVQSTCCEFGKEDDDVKAEVIAEYLSKICDVELFLRGDKGRMSKFIPQQK